MKASTIMPESKDTKKEYPKQVLFCKRKISYFSLKEFKYAAASASFIASAVLSKPI